MRRPLHARLQTIALRNVYPAIFGGFALLWVTIYGTHLVVTGGSVIPGILISSAVLVYGLGVSLWGRQFCQVWLDGDVLEVRQGRGLFRISLEDVTMVELVRGRPSYIRLRFKGGRAPLRFIPVDASFFDGGGEGTQKELKRLVARSKP